MKKLSIIFALATLISSQAIFAEDTQKMSSDNNPCAAVAKACADAGFTRAGDPGKRFWQDCMKQIILGKNVEGAKVDASVAKSCRVHKISKLKKELKEFQNAN